MARRAGAQRSRLCKHRGVSSPAITTSKPSAVSSWIAAARPATLPASTSGVVVGIGAALAVAPFRPDTALGCLAAALLLQVFANFANDLSDFRRGADTPDRLGPTRAVAAGLISPREMQAGMLAMAVAAGLDGAYLTLVGGPGILGLGIAAVLAALAYTGGPWPFGYRGLGELFVFIFFGPVCVAATAFLQAGRVEPLFLLASIPPGAIAMAILVVNNLRDVETDREAGKRTLAVRFGKGFARGEYVACLAAAGLVPIALLGARLARAGDLVPSLLVLIPLLACPPAIGLVRAVFHDGEPRRLNLVLRDTARVGLMFGALFALGLAAGGWPA